MSKHCEICNKKKGFFDIFFENKYCVECYNKKIAGKHQIEEMQKKEEEREFQEQKEQERKIKTEKMNSARDYLLYTDHYWSIIKNIDNIPFHYSDIFVDSIKDKFDIIKLLLEEIIEQLPKELNLDNIKEITTYRKSAKIIDEILKPYVKRELDYVKHCKIILEKESYSQKPNGNILDDKEYNSRDCISIYELFDFQNSVIPAMLNGQIELIELLQKHINGHIERSREPNKYDYNQCIAFKKETELEQTYEIIYIYYDYAMMIIYYIYFNKIVDKIINTSELYDIYTKLNMEVHNNSYIIEKLFPIYNSLYKNEFDIIFEDEKAFRFLIETFQAKENVIEKQDFIDIDSSILNIDINKYINIYNDDELFGKIVDEINTNIVSYKKFLSIDDIFDINIYSNYHIKILNEIKKQQSILERDRILNGNMQQEKEFVQNSFDYSNINNGYEFENFVANLYKLLGYKILDVTNKSGDQGADVIIEKNNIKFAIQVKYYNNAPVGNKAIQEVVAGKNFYKTDKAMVVTNSTFTKQAKELAKANDVILVDGAELDLLIEKCKAIL